MAPLPKTGYLSKVGLVFLLTGADLLINCTADHNDDPAQPYWVPITWISAQFAIQLANCMLVFLLFFGTYLFQARGRGRGPPAWRWKALVASR
jgi:hypothetical protein